MVYTLTDWKNDRKEGNSIPSHSTMRTSSHSISNNVPNKPIKRTKDVEGVNYQQKEIVQNTLNNKTSESLNDIVVDSNKPIVEKYHMIMEITRYPNGQQWQKVTSCWKEGVANKVTKRKPNKSKNKGKKTIIKTEESY